MLKINIYSYAYLLTNIFGTYTIYKFMKVFFEERRVNRKIEFLSYTAYFFVINFIYIVVKVPIITFVCNLAGFLALTFNYEVSLKKRLVSVILIYAILMLVESIVVIATGYVKFSLFDSNYNYSSIVGLVIIKIVSYAVVLIIENFKNIKKGTKISNTYWLCVLLIPMGTLYISFTVFMTGSLSIHHVLISITVLFMINILTFYLYDVVNKSFEVKLESALINEQNRYYHKQFEIMKKIYKNTKSVRHDMKNHLTALDTYISKDEKEKALKYIADIVNVIQYKNDYSHSGNMEIDSIINYKLQEANSKNIEPSVKLNIPSDLNISSPDMVIILGNLLDNALEAASKCEKDKKINILINYKKNRLFIHVDNTFDGVVEYKAHKIITSHKDKENRGIGLSNIQNVLDKYNGIMKIRHTDSKFEVDIIMYTS